MKSLQSMLGKLGTEWERLLCAAIAIAMLLTMYGGYERLRNPFDKEGSDRAGKVDGGRKFAAHAWAFLSGNPPHPQVDRNHAFHVTGTVFLPPKPPVEVANTPPPPPPPKPETTGFNWGPKTLPKTTTDNDGGNTKPPPPPPPKARDFLVYKGYLKSPSGQPMAYLTREHTLGKRTTDSSTAFLEPGQTILGLTVVEVNENTVVLKGEDGEPVTIGIHTKRQIKSDSETPPTGGAAPGDGN